MGGAKDLWFPDSCVCVKIWIRTSKDFGAKSERGTSRDTCREGVFPAEVPMSSWAKTRTVAQVGMAQSTRTAWTRPGWLSLVPFKIRQKRVPDV